MSTLLFYNKGMLFSLFQSLLAHAEPLDVIVISDLNSSYGSVSYNDEIHDSVQYIIDQRPDLVLVTGDMVAGQKEGLPYEAMWSVFHNAVTIPLEEHNIPIFVTPGNHDASGYMKYAMERSIFVEEWLAFTPDVEFITGSNYPLYYAFVAENTLFVSLDNTRPGSLGSEQTQWLDQVLEQPYQNKIVFGHLPTVPFVERKKNEYLMQPDINPLFQEHNVDLYISGHHHAYYPGTYQSLSMLSMPCLGSGSRHLFDSETQSHKGIVELQIHNRRITYEGLNAADNFSVIPRSSLPEVLDTPLGLIYRDDIPRSHRLLKDLSQSAY